MREALESQRISNALRELLRTVMIGEDFELDNSDAALVMAAFERLDSVQHDEARLLQLADDLARLLSDASSIEAATALLD